MLKPLFIGVFTFIFTIFPYYSIGSFPKSNPEPGITSTRKGLWSIFSNPAGVADSSRFRAGAYYRSGFAIKELSESGFAFSFPVIESTYCGFGYHRFGYKLYKQEHLAIGMSRKFGNAISAGISFDMLSLSIAGNYGKATAFTATAGLSIYITREVRIGFSVFNPGRTKLNIESVSRYPVIFQSGLTASFGQHAELSGGIEKADNTKLIYTGSFNYNLSNKFKIVAGASNGADAFFFGYSFLAGHCILGMYSGYHHLLGFSPSINIIYKK